MPTIAEKLRNEGKEIGKELGKELRKEEFLWKLIQERFREEADVYKHRLKGLRSDEMDRIGVALFNMKNVHDLEKYL